MTQLIPNYKPPQKKRRAKSISGCDTRDASTVTDDIRIRPNRFALRLAVRPVQQRQAGPARNQPSTSAESTNTQTVAETQTEENEILPAQEVQRVSILVKSYNNQILASPRTGPSSSKRSSSNIARYSSEYRCDSNQTNPYSSTFRSYATFYKRCSPSTTQYSRIYNCCDSQFNCFAINQRKSIV